MIFKMMSMGHGPYVSEELCEVCVCVCVCVQFLENERQNRQVLPPLFPSTSTKAVFGKKKKYIAKNKCLNQVIFNYYCHSEILWSWIL